LKEQPKGKKVIKENRKPPPIEGILTNQIRRKLKNLEDGETEPPGTSETQVPIVAHPRKKGKKANPVKKQAQGGKKKTTVGVRT